MLSIKIKYLGKKYSGISYIRAEYLTALLIIYYISYINFSQFLLLGGGSGWGGIRYIFILAHIPMKRIKLPYFRDHNCGCISSQNLYKRKTISLHTSAS